MHPTFATVWLFLLLLLPVGVNASAEEAPAPNQAEAPLPRITPQPRKELPFKKITEERYRELTSIPSRPHRCPICRYMVEIPLAEPEWTEYDADLCPHPEGRVTFYTPIVLCPNCGFSAYREDFTKAQSATVVRWVETELRGPTRATLHQIFGLKVPIGEEDLVSLFRQEDLPDILRCENALAYYKRFGDEDDPLRMAKVTWTTAWAHRRLLSGPIEAAALLPHVQPTQKKVNRRLPPNADTAIRADHLGRLYESSTRLDPVERLIVLLFLAGDYARLGAPDWASQCLEKIKAEAGAIPPDAKHDPWISTVDTKTEDPVLAARMKRQAFLNLASTFNLNLQREQELLQEAAELVRESLRRKRIALEEVPAMIYLVGEFERRCGQFTRARTWYDYASILRSPRRGAEIWAGHQIDFMEEYMKDIGLAGYPADPKAVADRSLLEALAAAIRTAYPDLQPPPGSGTGKAP